MSGAFTESVVEGAALGWFGALGYGVLHGPEIAVGETTVARTGFSETILPDRLRDTLLPERIFHRSV